MSDSANYSSAVWFGFPPFITTVSQNLYVLLGVNIPSEFNGSIEVTALIAGTSYNIASLTSNQATSPTLYQVVVPIGTDISTISVSVSALLLGVAPGRLAPIGFAQALSASVYEIYIQ